MQNSESDAPARDESDEMLNNAVREDCGIGRVDMEQEEVGLPSTLMQRQVRMWGRDSGPASRFERLTT